MDNYVLGAGLAGLITGFILNWPVIGETIGGQQKASFPLGPRILELTEDTEWLMTLLHLSIEPRIYKVGYYDQGSIKSEATETFRKEYYFKTRGKSNPTPSSMSSGKKEIVGWPIDLIIDNLIKRTMIIPGIIGGIQLEPAKKILLCRDKNGYRRPIKSIYFRRIINTLPLNIYYHLIGNIDLAVELKAIPTQFTLVRCDSPCLTNGRDYIYIADMNLPAHRITKISDCKYVIESKVSDPMRLIPSLVSYEQHVVVPNCQIIDNVGTREVGSVPMIGRYASWDHGIKIEDVIRRVRELARGS